MNLLKDLKLLKERIEKAMNNNITAVLLFIIVIFGATLRIYKLGFKSLWGDEIGQVLVSKNTIAGILEGHHLAPPLDYIILHFFLYFGDSEFIARLPSAIFGILAIILIYKVGKILFGAKEGLISAFLLSISPMHIWYSQEARMYSLFTFLSLLSLFFFYKATKENNKKSWAGFILSTLLCVYTHYYAFFVILIEMLFLLFILIKNRYSVRRGELSGNIGKTTLLSFVFSVIIIFLLFTPWLNVFLVQTHGLHGVLWYGLQPNLFFFYSIFGALSVFYGGYALLNTSGIIINLVIFMIGFLYVSIFLYGILASIKIKKYEDQIILLFLWMTVPVVVSFVISYYRGPITTYRNMIFILPMYLMVISRGITSISQPIILLTDRLTSKTTIINQIKNKQLIISLIVIILFTCISITAIENGYEKQKEDWRGTTDYLTTHVKEAELIVIFDDSASGLAFYYKGDAKIIPLPKNITSVNIVNTASSNYTKMWFVSSPCSGVNNELLNWLNSNCKLEREGSPGRRRISRSGESLERGAIYSYSTVREYTLNNVSTPQESI